MRPYLLSLDLYWPYWHKPYTKEPHWNLTVSATSVCQKGKTIVMWPPHTHHVTSTLHTFVMWLPHTHHVTSTHSSCKHTIMWLPHNSHVTSTLHVTCTQMAWLVCEKSFCHPHCIHLSWNFSTLNQFWGIGHYTVYIPRSYIQLAPRTVLPSLSLVPRPFVEETFYLINGLGTRLARS